MPSLRRSRRPSRSPNLTAGLKLSRTLDTAMVLPLRKRMKFSRLGRSSRSPRGKPGAMPGSIIPIRIQRDQVDLPNFSLPAMRR
eukprot:scaffold234138_cov11-Prasinocladus_malaysianus.AAC.1